VLQRATSLGTERGLDEGSGEHEGQWQTVRREEALSGKALSDIPALKPYWGKPAVRNFREGNGNVGIIRSPLRAIALPDQSCAQQCRLPTWAHKRPRLAHNSVCIGLAVSRTTVSARRGLSRGADCSGSPANGFQRAYRVSRQRGNCALPFCHRGT
jgi:hypothetical protein